MPLPLLDLSQPDEPLYRAIAPDVSDYNLIAEVTVEEDHNDELVITEHPIELGAMMSDHAYLRPPECRLRVGWSNAAGGYAGYARDIYNRVINLQRARQPCQIWTGKRFYNNMLVASCRETTNDRTEYVFLGDILFRQVCLVSTQTTNSGNGVGSAGVNPQASGQADPSATTPNVSTGQGQLGSGPSAPSSASSQDPFSGGTTGPTQAGGQAGASVGQGHPNSSGGGVALNPPT